LWTLGNTVHTLIVVLWRTKHHITEHRKRKKKSLSQQTRRVPSRWPRGTLSPQKLEITSPTSGGRSVGIVRSRTQTVEFSFFNHNRLTNIHQHMKQWLPLISPRIVPTDRKEITVNWNALRRHKSHSRTLRWRRGNTDDWCKFSSSLYTIGTA
jgi:hypothetical protein